MSPIGPHIPADPRPNASVCPCCTRHAARLHRVRLLPGTGWKLGCAICVAAALENHEHATYGGSIPGSAARRRRRHPSQSRKTPATTTPPSSSAPAA